MGLSAGPVCNTPRRRLLRMASCGAAALLPWISGCAVVSVVSAAATVTAGGVSTAVDVGVGAAKVTGKVIGKGVDVLTGSAAPKPAESAGVPKPAPR